jgi:hypothetical protein
MFKKRYNTISHILCFIRPLLTHLALFILPTTALVQITCPYQGAHILQATTKVQDPDARRQTTIADHPGMNIADLLGMNTADPRGMATGDHHKMVVLRGNPAAMTRTQASSVGDPPTLHVQQKPQPSFP